MRSSAQADLTWLNTADVLRAFGLPPGGSIPLRGILELLVRIPARRFAAQLTAFDAVVGAAGLQAGGAWICGCLAAEVAISGAAPPPSGPVLIAANHPGLLDAAAVFSAIPRPDLRVLAIARPFLRAMPHIADRLIAVGTTPSTRSAALRSAVRHLRDGGALLTFPAGRIEPDPLTMDGAVASLETWASGIDSLWRLGDRPPLMPFIVSGAIAPRALAHPLTRLRRTEDDQRWMAAILQLLAPQQARACVEVRRGPLITRPEGTPGAAVIAAATDLIRESRS